MRKRTLGLVGLVSGALWTSGAVAQQPAAPPAQPAANADANTNTNVDARAGDIPGPIDSLQDLQDAGKMAFKMADTNNDGLVSQKEATDAANLLVGGFFFRADANGDGTLTREEAQAARESLLRQKPLLRVVVERAKTAKAAEGGNNATPNPILSLGNLLDSNNDRQLQGAEVRQAVETTVQSFYAAADTNRDGQMSPAEVNAAILGVAKAAADAAFAAADKDNNGTLSQEEFVQSITEPAQTVFVILDVDANGQLTQEELKRAQQVVGRQLRNLQVPEPANSAANILGSGRVPQEVAPVPDFQINVPAGNNARPTQPAQPQPGQPIQIQPTQPGIAPTPATPAPGTTPAPAVPR